MKRLAWAAVALGIAGGCRHAPPPTDPFLRTTVPPPATTQVAPGTGDAYSGATRSSSGVSGAPSNSGYSSGGATAPTSNTPTYQIPPKDKFAPAGGFHYQQGSTERKPANAEIAALLATPDESEVQELLAAEERPPQATVAPAAEELASVDEAPNETADDVDGGESSETPAQTNRIARAAGEFDGAGGAFADEEEAEQTTIESELASREFVQRNLADQDDAIRDLAATDSARPLSPPSDQTTLRIVNHRDVASAAHRSAQRAARVVEREPAVRENELADRGSAEDNAAEERATNFDVTEDARRPEPDPSVVLASNWADADADESTAVDEPHSWTDDDRSPEANEQPDWRRSERPVTERSSTIKLTAGALDDPDDDVANDASARQAEDDPNWPDSDKNASTAVVHHRYGFDPQYEWLRGRLEYSHSRRQWKLRYIPIDGQTDMFGGSVIIANPGALNDAQPGDLVEAHGVIVGDAKPSRGFSPGYQLSTLVKLRTAD